MSQAQLKSAIDKLGDLDYETRTAAARTVRRAESAQAVPALVQAVAEHADGYVRYRALVLLTGFGDPRTTGAMRESLSSPNDRLRTVAYSYFEHNPDRAMTAGFLAALDKETAEFVRPALVRALAALGSDPRVQQVLVKDVARGQDFFRSIAIEALGDYKAGYAFEAIDAVAKLDGPLQEDAALAIGKIGDRRGLTTLAELQKTAPAERQPSIAAAICLFGLDCNAHQEFLSQSLSYADKNPGYQNLLRAAAAGLAALALAGHPQALDSLLDVGIPAREDSTRAPAALAVGTIALRNPALLLAALEKRSDRAAAMDLLAEGFDMLEEDLDKEAFFVLVRKTYWAAAGGSPARELMQTLIGKLDF
ncbi:MAG TPA: HEAT repeat domain-containing protein [Vicinamibacterales bacterium]|nr:HEAT repeat domain-containing protein [Vicinamibacterales bacterium]